MSDIQTPLPVCPQCYGAMTLIESRVTSPGGDLVRVFQCTVCGLHYPRFQQREGAPPPS